jgi:hypothetical protein
MKTRDRTIPLLKRLAVWVLESVFVDLGLGTLLLLMALVEDPHGHLEMPIYRAILAFAAAVLMVGMFATGYLATSAIARALVPIKRWWLYPLVLAALFSVHLEILFIAMGGTGWTRGEQIAVRFGGAGTVFLVAFAGNALLSRWSKPSFPQEILVKPQIL